MGTKRVGLARTQALIQNLKRELDMNNATLVNTKGVELTNPRPLRQASALLVERKEMPLALR